MFPLTRATHLGYLSFTHSHMAESKIADSPGRCIGPRDADGGVCEPLGEAEPSAGSGDVLAGQQLGPPVVPFSPLFWLGGLPY